MNTRDLILLQLGIGTADRIHDEIVENFDVYLTSDDIEFAIEIKRDELTEVGNELISILYCKIARKYSEEFCLDERKFSMEINMGASHIYYNGEEIRNVSDIERLTDKQ